MTEPDHTIILDNTEVKFCVHLEEPPLEILIRQPTGCYKVATQSMAASIIRILVKERQERRDLEKGRKID